MNNLKKTAMGLMVGAMAIGFSAFKSAPAKENAKANTYYYVLNQQGNTYTRVGLSMPSPDNCEQAEIDKCIIGFASDQGPTINQSSSQQSRTFESDNKGSYDLN